MLTFEESLRYTQILAALAVLVQVGESGVLRKRFRPIEMALPSWVFDLCLVVQVLSAISVLFFPISGGFAAVVLFVSSAGVAVYFRGSFNGGSDAMTSVLLFALAVAAVFPESPKLGAAALVYIAAQSLLSYVVAGVAKLRRQSWRSGAALLDYVSFSSYDVPAVLGNFASTKPKWVLASSWGLILFELGFAVVVFHPRLLIVWLGLGSLFHIANFVSLGLNRFVFVWIATYPALLYLSGRISSH